MPREGAIIFRDLVGKLDVLNIECEKCGRRGRYHLDKLIARYGIDEFKGALCEVGYRLRRFPPLNRSFADAEDLRRLDLRD